MNKINDKIYFHPPALLNEIIEICDLKKDSVFIDMTIGEGGHSSKIINLIPDGLVIGIDRDKDILECARERLSKIGDNFKLFNDEFSKINEIYEDISLPKADCILLDLGISLYHYRMEERGFAFDDDISLDMRANKSKGISAKEVINTFSAEELVRIFKNYGEERFAKKIANEIVSMREIRGISSAKELAELIKKIVPINKKKEKYIHPATKVFMALRIFVNEELLELEKVLEKSINFLKTDGKILVISYHSLEDRIVKNFFKEQSLDCICPPEFPVCRCEKKAVLKIMTKKPIVSTKEEVDNNPCARSAKLRVAIKL